ncbi:hypothetical protein ASE38_16920 [Cellulomonas sp. Root930]|nr:hypothetical protein ASE38_16920 [Cellulomonas sp. Root930]
MTTYGSLMEQAARHIHAGASQTAAHRFNDLRDAHLAVASFHGLLDAIERHVWHLVNPGRATTIYGTSAPPQGTDAVEYAALRMVTAIPTLEDRDHRLPPIPQPIDHPWADAARALGAAVDLLATHTDVNGMSRSPDGPVVWDFTARRRALGRVADLTGALLSGSDELFFRTSQAGAHWSSVRRWIPDFEESRAWAADAVHRAKDRTGAGPLDEVGLANPTIRTTNQLLELSDRIGRLRRSAWGVLSRPDFSVATLRDFAGVGLAVNAHSAAFHGVDLRQVADNPPLAQVSQIVQARAWQRVLGDLHDVISPGPGDPTVRADAIAVRQLLAQTAPLTGDSVGLAASHKLDRRVLGAVLNGAVDTMGQIAAWNSMSYNRLARSGHVRIRAANLTGEQITDSPELASAKLQGTSAAVPPALLECALCHYRDAAERIPRPSLPARPLSAPRHDAPRATSSVRPPRTST